jgi:hypothetical protein
MARYVKKMEDRLGAYWYALDKIHLDDLSLGTVTTTFKIPAAGGKVRNVKVTSNTGGRFDALVALRAIDEFRASPIPPDVLAEVHQDYILVEESFTIFANRWVHVEPGRGFARRSRGSGFAGSRAQSASA